MGENNKKKICFVCLGNIVRSPLAEHLFRRLVRERGLHDSYEAASAGTGSWHVGEPPDPRMRRVAARRGLDYTGAACQFQPDDLDSCDLIIAMDRSNRESILRMARSEEQRRKVRLMREFDPHAGTHAEVPDPYYGGVDGFERVYDIVERSVEGLLQALENGEWEVR